MLLRRSLGGAILASAIYLGEAITGNVAYLAILRGISWRWPVVICGVALSAVSVAVALLVKEPPVGKFVNRKKVRAHPEGSRNGA